MSPAQLHRAGVPGEAWDQWQHTTIPTGTALPHPFPLVRPLLQRYIIRIIFMVPVYAIGSFCSLQWRDGAIYFVTLRDW